MVLYETLESVNKGIFEHKITIIPSLLSTKDPQQSLYIFKPRNVFFLPPKPQHLNSQFQHQQQNVTTNNDDEAGAENSGDMNEKNDKTVINSINYIVLDLDSTPSTDNSSPKVSDTGVVNGISTFKMTGMLFKEHLVN